MSECTHGYSKPSHCIVCMEDGVFDATDYQRLIPIQYNNMMGQYEIKMELEARITPKGPPRDYNEYPSMYAPVQPISVILSEEYIAKCNDPEQIINYVQRQVQNIWTQAVAGMASKYSDVILENIMPAVEKLLHEKDWGMK